MSNNRKDDILIEIGTEELPPKALSHLSTAFTRSVLEGLKQAELEFGTVHSYASPRRLAIWIEAADTQQADKTIERRGPALQAAYDDEGCPTKAAEGFAKSCCVEVEQLDKLETNKGSWLVYQLQQQGKPLTELLADIVITSLDKLPIPKRMRWGNLDSQFVRPVHWAVLMVGNNVIETEILSVQSGNVTYGHRFHVPAAIKIPKPSEYEVLLESKGKVVADFNRRKQTVRAQAEQAALDLNGNAVIDEALLDEVTSMVEWPVAVVGNFDERYLDVPQEVLISTMSTNQKYFHVLDNHDKLMPHFITISNIESKDPSQVQDGNERVIRPRFADAEFFWNQDRKQSLEQRIKSLKTVVFQKQLGTLFDKTERVRKIAGFIADALDSDVNQADRAAQLCKCDLMTDMVGEFPSLQGVMGAYYANHDGETTHVATALSDYYKPRFAGDGLPDHPVSQALALADRIDTLVGIFAIGQIPTGDKDPFGLRRAALGVLRILIEQQLPLDLADLLKQSAEQFAADIKADKAIKPLLHFILERLGAYYQDQNVSGDVLAAVLATDSTVPVDINKRIKAVAVFRDMPQAESLAAANKRIGNILKKIDGKLPSKINTKLFAEAEETELHGQLNAIGSDLSPMLAEGDYENALSKLATLRDSVDAFFDNVMVMADDDAVKNNRIALLNNLHSQFSQIADISQLQIQQQK